MTQSRQSVAATIEDILKRRPILAPVLNGLKPLLETREKLSEELDSIVKKSSFSLPEWQPERASVVDFLLSNQSLKPLEEAFLLSAEFFLPVLKQQESISSYFKQLQSFFKTKKNSKRAISSFEHFIAANEDGLMQIISSATLPPSVFLFVQEFILSSVLRAVMLQYNATPWNEGNSWRQGYCPVCGSMPSIAWLSKPVIDEKNPYLAGGGGKKSFYCTLCGTNWQFRRGACPSCAKEGSGVIEILREAEGSMGERIDWCTNCKTYCPTVDLRERNELPNLDALVLGMMHLDMVAAEKKLQPLRISFWNQF